MCFVMWSAYYTFCLFWIHIGVPTLKLLTNLQIDGMKNIKIIQKTNTHHHELAMHLLNDVIHPQLRCGSGYETNVLLILVCS